MRMKAKYYLLPLAFLLGSCTTDFLEVAPTTIIPEEDSYQTETDIYKALMSAYAPLLAMDFCRSDFTPKGEYHPYQFISDILADDYNAVGGSGPGDCPYLQLMFDYRLTPEQSLIALWEALYKGIYRSNFPGQPGALCGRGPLPEGLLLPRPVEILGRRALLFGEPRRQAGELYRPADIGR